MKDNLQRLLCKRIFHTILKNDLLVGPRNCIILVVSNITTKNVREATEKYCKLENACLQKSKYA